MIFIASLFVVSQGLDSTGVTTWAGQQLIAGAGSSQRRLVLLMMVTVAVLTALISVNGSVAALLLGLVLLTFTLGQLTSNMATALIVLPVAVSSAAELDVSAKPVLMAVAVASAASFLKPVATPANLMVLGRVATASATTGSSAFRCSGSSARSRCSSYRDLVVLTPSREHGVTYGPIVPRTGRTP